jgi:hypothetical protein
LVKSLSNRIKTLRQNIISNSLKGYPMLNYAAVQNHFPIQFFTRILHSIICDMNMEEKITPCLPESRWVVFCSFSSFVKEIFPFCSLYKTFLN